MGKQDKQAKRIRGKISQIGQVITLVIMESLFFRFSGSMRMAVLIVIPIMGGIAFGFLDYLRKTEPKQLFPEKIWQVIVLAIVLINIILSLIGSENFIMDLVLCPFSGVIAYAILTGQGYLVAGGNGKNKGSWKEGKEYVVGTGLYRDKNGNYYTNTGTPTAAPVNTQHKSK